MDLFRNQELETIERQGGELRVAGCRIVLPRVYGFCGGVRNALRKLQSTLDRTGDRTVWLLGEIIHNDTVNARLRQRGVRILPEDELERIFTCREPGDTIVIPAFGIPRGIQNRLRAECAEACTLVDTTCGCVQRIWAFVEDMAAAGRTIVIHGKPHHPETLATLSRAQGPHNCVLLVPDKAAAERLADALRRGTPEHYPAAWIKGACRTPSPHLALVNQTTMLCSETVQIENLLQAAVAESGGDLLLSNSICRATEQRQRAAEKLCRAGCDTIVVVGGFTSSNTNSLYRLASRYAPAYFVRDADDLQATRIQHYVPEKDRVERTRDWLPTPPCTVGVLAGASCPPSVIGAVVLRLGTLIRNRAEPQEQA